MILLDLLEAVRKSGLPVTAVDGWQTRGHGPMSAVETIVVHHTATPLTAKGNYPSLGIVRDGRPGLSGPLAQLGLGRDGTVYVIAAGVSFHAGAVFNGDQDNWHAIGIEAEHDGLSPWPEVMVDAYARLCRALIDHYGISVDRVQGHKEVATPRGRKTDPNFDMDEFRARITDLGDDDMANYADQLNRIEAAQKVTADALAALVTDEKRRNVNRLDREKALAKALREQGVDVDAILAAVDGD